MSKLRPTTQVQEMSVQSALELTTTLGELPVWEIHLDVICPGKSLTAAFEQEPLLPGIILTQNHHYRGMISRRRFFERMSRPYSQEIFTRRPIEILYAFLEVEHLILPEDTSIIQATRIALQRSPELVYEPIVIQSKTVHTSAESTLFETYKLLDFHQLLLDYSQIPDLALHHLQKTEQGARVAEANLRKLQNNYTRYLQTEKMASLGQLVAGVAHEINNPMNFIHGNLRHLEKYNQKLLKLIQLYQHNYPEPTGEIKTEIESIDLPFLQADMPKMIESMKVGTDRIRQIVLSLRNFSRADEAELKVVDIHEGIDSTLMILEHRLKAHSNYPAIKIIKDYGDLPLVECYPGQLNQVFMNILVNAIDALEDVNERRRSEGLEHHLGQVIIRTSFQDSGQNSGWVQIAIADNGSGIPESIQSRIFDPFFTTKPVGKGTGMGMSISHQIISERHSGRLNFYSTPEAGTEFVIQLPIDLGLN